MILDGLLKRLKPSLAIAGVVDAVLDRIIKRDVKFRFSGALKLNIGGQDISLEYSGVIDPEMSNNGIVDIDGDGRPDA